MTKTEKEILEQMKDELLDGPTLMGTTIEDGLTYLCRNSELFYMDLEGDGY